MTRVADELRVTLGDDDVRVNAYIHYPSNGDAPYVVVDIDADDPAIRVTLNDAYLFSSPATSGEREFQVDKPVYLVDRDTGENEGPYYLTSLDTATGAVTLDHSIAASVRDIADAGDWD